MELHYIGRAGSSAFSYVLKVHNGIDELRASPGLGYPLRLPQSDNVCCRFLDNAKPFHFKLSNDRRFSRSRRASHNVSLHKSATKRRLMFCKAPNPYHGLLMRIHTRSKFASAVGIVCAFLLARGISLAAEKPPTWAYGTEGTAANPSSGSAVPTNLAEAPRTTPENSLKHRPGSASEFTRAQINDPFGPADWYPGDHPEMPEIVAHGRKPNIWACSLCHYPNGKGRPENAGINGLPVSYFIHQMNDFRNDLRKSADVRKKNTNLMIAYAKAMTDDEIKAAAEYFGAMKWTAWIKVVETDSVPKTRLSVGMFLPLEGREREPLGQRIIEMPEDPDATEVLRDPRSGFIAYVPFGSIKKGTALVTTATGKTVQCGVCHGVDLKGLGPVPGLAGRSPSYLVRQMYDMQKNTRKGEWTDLMAAVVSRLSEDDMLNIAAYISSRTP
jgi:cytochrome c553